MPGVAAIVLAAGASTRMGRPKQLLPVDGVPMLVRAVDAARAACAAPIVVVLGRDADACRAILRESAGVTIVENSDRAGGLGSSLHVGAQALPPDTTAAFILLADQPLVTADTLGRLVDAAVRTTRPVAVAAFAGQIGPPVYVSGSTLQQFRDWPHTHGAKKLWQERPEDVIRVDCSEAARDVDTPADYAAFGDTGLPAVSADHP